MRIVLFAFSLKRHVGRRIGFPSRVFMHFKRTPLTPTPFLRRMILYCRMPVDVNVSSCPDFIRQNSPRPFVDCTPRSADRNSLRKNTRRTPHSNPISNVIERQNVQYNYQSIVPSEIRTRQYGGGVYVTVLKY